jgi:hypothetical protein
MVIMTDELDLVDIWRELNPDLRRFTWRRSRPLQQSRLDYFMVSESFLDNSVDADIHPGYRTDHSCITLCFGCKKDNKKRGLWKFNSSLLKDQEYLDEVNEVIDLVLEEYVVTPYARENVTNIPNTDVQFTISDQLFLDTLLMKIRSKSISYATMKKRKSMEKEKELETTIENFENKEYLDDNERLQLNNCKNELILLREKKMEGVLLRSRARWIADGEKVTSYFCSLEKRNYVNKRITKLECNGNTLYNEKEIASEVNNFYKHLYEETEVEECEIGNLIKDIPQLSEMEQTSLEGKIDLEEASFALKNMSNKKSPGSDGFTVEFFKVFWRRLGIFVVRALNESFEKGELSSTQKEGLIVCIPKGDKPREFIQNWRPISLLNVVYKIGSACIANRLKGVLPSLINEDQSGFIKDRYIGDNIRLIYDVIDYLQTVNKPGLMLCLDFYKAYDSLSWNFMFKVLKAFGFGPDFCRWVQTFYKNIKSTVLVNGNVTSWFHVQKGCRQGDPISSYLFVICVEILAIMIRENKDIKGIKIGKTENKISQYADDTEVLLEGDEQSFVKTLEVINLFGKVSGLKLNTNKSCAIWLGSKKNSKTIYMPHLHMEWNPKQFKILGIWFTNDLTDCVKINFNEKFLEVKALYKLWLKRQLTPLGRVAVLKSLILSKLIYLWMLLPNPPDNTVNLIQKSVFKFVWNCKNDKIARKTSTKNVADGGIGIPNVKNYIHALKLMWIRKLVHSKHKWTEIIKLVNKKILCIEKIGNCLNDGRKVNVFWRDVFNAYEVFGKKVALEHLNDIVLEPIFCNTNILVGNKTIFYSDWIEKNVYNIGNLLLSNGNFLTFAQFTNKYGIVSNFLQYSSCVHAVKQYVQSRGVHLTEEFEVQDRLHKTLNTIVSIHRGAKKLYDVLMHDDVKPNCCDKWDERIQRRVEWKTIFNKIRVIKEVKLKWFQLRIVHRILGTNVVTAGMGLENNDSCTFCNTEKENIQHLMWHCPVVQTFWKKVERLINDKCVHVNGALSFTEHLIIFGCDKNFRTDQVFDVIILLAKEYIYNCKMRKELPQIEVFLLMLKKRYAIEKYIAIVNMVYEKMLLVWMPYLVLF